MKRIKQRKPYQRPNIVCLRLSDSELSLLDTHADQCQASRSEYIRNLGKENDTEISDRYRQCRDTKNSV